MKGKTLSNIPAPYVYVDAESLFESAGFFSLKPKMEYKRKIEGLMRIVNIGMYISPFGVVTQRLVENSPFIYTTFQKGSVTELAKLLRAERTIILADVEQIHKFAWSNMARDLNNSIESILAEINS